MDRHIVRRFRSRRSPISRGRLLARLAFGGLKESAALRMDPVDVTDARTVIRIRVLPEPIERPANQHS